MPRYDYKCHACGITFEVTQRMSDPPLTKCTCGKEGQVEKLMSAGSGLIFKGSGFYITDYKNQSGAPAASSAAGTAASPAPAAGAPATAPTTTPAAAPAAAPTTSAPAAPAAGCGTSCGCN